MKTFTKFAIGALAVALVGCAPESSRIKGGGGSLLTSQAEVIRQIIASGQLKQRVLEYFRGVNPDTIPEALPRQMFIDLVAGGGEFDILASPFVIAANCLDQEGGSQAASTTYAYGAAICFNPQVLAAEGADMKALIALTMHEISHHKGYGESQAVALQTSWVAHQTGGGTPPPVPNPTVSVTTLDGLARAYVYAGPAASLSFKWRSGADTGTATLQLVVCDPSVPTPSPRNARCRSVGNSTWLFAGQSSKDGAADLYFSEWAAGTTSYLVYTAVDLVTGFPKESVLTIYVIP